jgi:hypothetical protein
MIDVQRPAEAPPTLAGGDYSGIDVLEALHATFLGKCYLCESPVDLGTFQVDHRKPRSDERFAHLVYAWSNLFPTCNEHECNQRRERKFPDGGLLDPGEGVEVRLVQRLEGAVSMSLRKAATTDFVFRAVNPADVAAVNTAKELDRIHNATGSRAGLKAKALRMTIVGHLLAVVPHVQALDTGRPAPRYTLAESEHIVAQAVSRRGPYTMLIRSYFAEIEAVRALFD